MFAIVAFNFADTYFVARLGTRELAAMAFTFPVVMVVANVALGLGVGAASVISRAIGEGDHERVRRLTTDSLALGLLLVVVFIAVGLATIDPVFRLLGADEEHLPLIREYMSVWYVGVVFVVIPMVGNNAIRATGDTTVPALIMVTAACLNVALDPLFIFGLWGFPKLGLLGAAVATVIGRALTCVLSLSVLHFRERMLDFRLPRLAKVWESWKRVLYIGLPSAATKILVPVSMGFLMRFASPFGEATVAGVGAGIRVEAFAVMVVGALGTALIPFVGQNWGASESGRVRSALSKSHLFSLGWGLCVWGAFLVSAPAIATLFRDEPTVTSSIILYLWVVPLGYGLQGVCFLTGAFFNAINQPLAAAGLLLVRIFAFYIPLAYVGANVWGLKGLFAGIALAEMLAGCIAFLWARKVCGKDGC